MSAERNLGQEFLSGQFEFELVMGHFKAKFLRAKEEQGSITGYRMFVNDSLEGVTDRIARFRLADSELVHDFDKIAQRPEDVLTVGLPIAMVDAENPVVLSDSPFKDDQPEFFVLYQSEGPIVVAASSMSGFLESDPDFVGKVLSTDIIPYGKENTQDAS